MAWGYDGRGERVVSIIAFGCPGLQNDTDFFSNSFGLPSVEITLIPMLPLPAFNATDPVQRDWAVQASLQAQWAHAIAPGAGLTVVIA